MKRALLLMSLSLLAVPATAHAQSGGELGGDGGRRLPGYPPGSGVGPFLRVPDDGGFYSPVLWMMPYPPDLGPVPIAIMIRVDPAKPFHPLYVPQFGKGWSYMPPGFERGSRGPGGPGVFLGLPHRVGEGTPTYSAITTSRAGRPRSAPSP